MIAVRARSAPPPPGDRLLRPFRHRAVVQRNSGTPEHLGQHEPVGRGLVAGVAIVDDRRRRDRREQLFELVLWALTPSQWNRTPRRDRAGPRPGDARAAGLAEISRSLGRRSWPDCRAGPRSDRRSARSTAPTSARSAGASLIGYGGDGGLTGGGPASSGRVASRPQASMPPDRMDVLSWPAILSVQ